MSLTTTVSPASQRTRTYATVVSGLLFIAFTLSVVHTLYAWQGGLEDPDFTVTSPLTWGYYAVAFAAATVVRRDRPWTRWCVATYLLVLLGISVFYYPTTFVPAHQTVFGWVENDLFVGLLLTALFLLVLQLRRITLVARR